MVRHYNISNFIHFHFYQHEWNFDIGTTVPLLGSTLYFNSLKDFKNEGTPLSLGLAFYPEGGGVGITSGCYTRKYIYIHFIVVSLRIEFLWRNK